MRRSLFLFVAGALALATSFGSANATVIEYGATNVSGNLWQYDYTVTNDSLGASLDEFTIFFQLGLYENIAVGDTPADWDPLAIQPDPGLPDDGFYDALALVSGIAPGGTLGGFSLTFNWLGAGTPGSQLFNIVDATTIETLEQGFTSLRGGSTPPTAVPEPVSPLLLGVGLALLALRASRIKLRRKNSGS